MKNKIHPTAIVEDNVKIGEHVNIWHFCHIRSNAEIGNNISIGKDSFIDEFVKIDDGCRIQNHVNIYKGVELQKYCFIGPAVTFTNDPFPRVGNKSWTTVGTIISNGASIGAGAVIRCGIKIGAFAMVGAGAIVTKDIEPFSLVLGIPAYATGKICACGQTQMPINTPYSEVIRHCCKAMMSENTLNLAISEMERLTTNESFVFTH